MEIVVATPTFVRRGGGDSWLLVVLVSAGLIGLLGGLFAFAFVHPASPVCIIISVLGVAPFLLHRMSMLKRLVILTPSHLVLTQPLVRKRVVPESDILRCMTFTVKDSVAHLIFCKDGLMVGFHATASPAGQARLRAVTAWIEERASRGVFPHEQDVAPGKVRELLRC